MKRDNVDFAVRVAAPLALEAYVFLYNSKASSLLDHVKKLRALPKVNKHNARAAAEVAYEVYAATTRVVYPVIYATAATAAVTHATTRVIYAAFYAAHIDDYTDDYHAHYAARAARYTLRLFEIENVPFCTPRINIMAPALAIKAVTILDAEIQADPRWWADKQALFAFAASVVADLG